jgi:hypothetical protein
MPAMRRDVSFRPAPLVRGGSRRITIMRFRPANISVINRRDSHAGKLRCNERVSSGTGLPRSRGRPERDLLNKGVDRSLHISRMLKNSVFRLPASRHRMWGHFRWQQAIENVSHVGVTPREWRG